jgi:tRNA(Ile)-lysidine synthase
LLIERAPAKPLTVAEFGAALTSLGRFESRPLLAVAVSGGPDSLALAILADRWSRESGGEICALTVDHRLRPESGAEIRQLEGWLSARAIRHEVLVWAGDKPTTGIQEAARTARYRLLAGWCREHGCLHLLTGHHGEDQLETHLIRRRAKSGPDGLAGMSAIRELGSCRLLRPLLGIAKDRLLALLRVEDQPFVSDPSNRDPAFERSRLRSSDGAMPDAADFPTLFAAIQAFGHRRAARARTGCLLLARAVSLHPAGFAVLDPGLASVVSREQAEQALSAVAATIGGRPYPARRERVARLREAIGRAGFRGHTLGGCRFVAWRQCILVLRELASAAEPACLAPGASILWDRRFDIRLPPAARAPVTVGYLGSAPTNEATRAALQARRAALPRLLFPTLPAAWDDDGIAAIPHLGYRREAGAGSPDFVFHPANPLTQAGFAVV